MAHTTKSFALTLIPTAGWLWLSFISILFCALDQRGSPCLTCGKERIQDRALQFSAFTDNLRPECHGQVCFTVGVGEEKMVEYSSSTGKAKNARDRYCNQVQFQVEHFSHSAVLCRCFINCRMFYRRFYPYSYSHIYGIMLILPSKIIDADSYIRRQFHYGDE